MHCSYLLTCSVNRFLQQLVLFCGCCAVQTLRDIRHLCSKLLIDVIESDSSSLMSSGFYTPHACRSEHNENALCVECK